jgi:phosphoserine aminotransferase
MSERVWNFNPGPAALPLPVLETVRDELLSYGGTGMSIMESSHRSPQFDGIIKEAEQRLRDLMGLGDEFAVLFLQGGANLQFHMVPLNLLPEDGVADYVDTGTWASRAIGEARKAGTVNVAASTEPDHYARVPRREELKLTPNAAYLHITTNNTIFGTQWASFPVARGTPLVADMSSDVLSRPVDFSQFGLAYAGAQKNLGPAGVTVVIVRRDLVGNAPTTAPAMLDYATHMAKGSLYNTPPCFAIYVMNLVLAWVQDQGGLSAIARRNQEKAQLLYETIDASEGFYRGTVQRESRSVMNVTFRLASEELEKAILQEAGAAGLKGLKGHRSVGGLRASLYNAVPLEAVERLVAFMRRFQEREES